MINSGDLIARLELDDPGAVTAAVPYPGGFPELGPPLVHSQGVDHRFKEAYAAAKMIMAGAHLVLFSFHCIWRRCCSPFCANNSAAACASGLLPEGNGGYVNLACEQAMSTQWTRWW